MRTTDDWDIGFTNAITKVRSLIPENYVRVPFRDVVQFLNSRHKSLADQTAVCFIGIVADVVSVVMFKPPCNRKEIRTNVN